jgi:hypothetical protein
LVAKSARPPEWPADRVERRAVADLVPYARNARTHSDFQVGEIAASIREWGWTVPVLVDEAGGIIAGHGRVLAARKLGIETVPVMVAAGWTEAQRRAYVLADNKLALNAGWDTDLLKVELARSAASGVRPRAHRVPHRGARGLAGQQRGPHRSRRASRSAGRAGIAPGRRVAARAAPAGLRRCHQRARRQPRARHRGDASPDGHGSALWGRV